MLQQGVQAGPEHTAAQAGLKLQAVVVHQEEVILQCGCRDVAVGAGSPWEWDGVDNPAAQPWLELTTIADFGPHSTPNPDPPLILYPSLTLSQELSPEQT